MATTPRAALITLDQAKLHLRLDPSNTDEDAYVQNLINAARSAAEGFTGRRFYVSTDEMAAAVLAGTAGSNPIVVGGDNADDIYAAMLLMIGRLYANREDQLLGGTGRSESLPTGAEQMLQMYRADMGL